MIRVIHLSTLSTKKEEKNQKKKENSTTSPNLNLAHSCIDKREQFLNHPELLQLDMRLVKPSATIRYTIDKGWVIVKGPNVRDNKFGQYRQHCQTLIKSPYYCGAEFSEGDQYIFDCANGTGSTGNLTVWRRVGTNHHLEKLVYDISSYHDSSNTH